MQYDPAVAYMPPLIVAGLVLFAFLLRKRPGVPPDRDHQTIWFERPEILRMCWADRIAMIWAVIVVGGVMLLQGGDGVSQTAPSAYGDLLVKIVFPLWLFLRLIDLITAGPRRRRAAREVREGRVPPVSIIPPPRARRAGTPSNW